MAAGAEETQPVSAFEEGAERGDAEDNTNHNNSKDKNKNRGGESPENEVIIRGRPPRPAPPESTESFSGFGRDLQVIGDKVRFTPKIRSGASTDIGKKINMEDEYVRIDNLKEHFGSSLACDMPCAYYGVFDGHEGKDAARFVKEKLLNFIVEDAGFPSALEVAVQRAFLRMDNALAKASLDQNMSSGTTAITVLIFGRNILVANVGDCRAVLSKKGRAVEMSRDHKPGCALERVRVEALGGYVDDGYLNGQLSVTRALGNWHIKSLRGVDGMGPLSCEPELRKALLSEEDEFLIIGCDGLWDVFTSQNAVDYARRRLREHNNPEQCAQELVAEALARESRDNLTVITVCLQADPPPRLSTPITRVRRSISVEGLHNLQGWLNITDD